MRFTLVVALTTPLVLASTSPDGSVKQRSDAATAAWTCTPPYNYCGWYLIAQDPAGWSGVLDPNALYQCVNGGVNILTTCANGCVGPTAHCK